MYEIDLNEHEYFGLCWRDKNGLRVSTELIIYLGAEIPALYQFYNSEWLIFCFEYKVWQRVILSSPI